MYACEKDSTLGKVSVVVANTVVKVIKDGKEPPEDVKAIIEAKLPKAKGDELNTIIEEVQEKNQFQKFKEKVFFLFN